MSAWVTEEIMRWGLRFCSRRSLWQQRSFLLFASLKDRCAPSKQFTHIWSPRQSQTWLSRSSVRSVRFYSQGDNHRDELEDRDHLPSPPADIEFDDEASPLRQRRSPFLDHLQHCGSPSDVLDLTCKYSPTVRQVSNCLTHMWASSKKFSEEQRRYELQLMFEHPAFDQLLQKAMKSVQHMRNEDVTYSLLSMVSLGVPQRSRVVQTFLRTCQEKLNDFDEKSLSILASSLKHMEDSANVVALKQGMRYQVMEKRLVVEARLPSIKRVMALQTMMRMLGKDAPKELKWKLEKKALSMTDQFSLPNAQYMISTMAAMGFFSKPLLDVCSKKITENIHGIPFNRLLKLLQSCRELLYRDAHLLTSISDYVASSLDIWTNKQLLLFLSMFESLVFCPAPLMEAYAERVIADPDVLTLKDLLCVLKVYSSLSYDLQDRRQQFLDSLSHVLSSYLPKISAFELLKAVYFLCLLGHFPYAPLEQLLQSSVLEKISASKFPQSQERMFQTVDVCLRIDRPPLPQPLTVPASVLGDRTPSSPSVNPRLSQDLQSVLGEQAHTMLQEGVVLENTYFIDAALTKPVPIQTSASEASSCAGERRSPAESSQRVAVIYAPQSGFCYGTPNPRSPLAVKVRHLKILGYNPVLVTEQDLQSESEEKRIDFLRGRIFPEHHTSETQPEKEHLGP